MAAPSSPCGDPASAAGHEDEHDGLEAMTSRRTATPAALQAGSASPHGPEQLRAFARRFPHDRKCRSACLQRTPPEVSIGRDCAVIKSSSHCSRSRLPPAGMRPGRIFMQRRDWRECRFCRKVCDRGGDAGGLALAAGRCCSSLRLDLAEESAVDADGLRPFVSSSGRPAHTA
jgi:hypothetical protein